MSKSGFLFKLSTIFLLVIVLCLASCANFQGTIYPFAVAFALAFISVGFKSYIVAPVYFLSTLVNGITESSLIISAYSTLILLFMGIINLRSGKIVKWWIGCIGVFISHLAFLYFNVFTSNLYLECSLTIIVSMLAFVCARHIFKAIKSRPLIFKLSLDESICLAFVVMVLSCGVACIDAIYFSFYHFLGALLILCSAYVLNQKHTIVLSLMYGLGASLVNLQVGYIALFSSVALAVVSLKSNYRVYSIFIALIVDVLFGMYFETNIDYNLMSVVESGVAGLIFAIIPNRILKNISGYVNSNDKNFGVKSIVNRNKLTMQNKLIELSNVFAEMDIVFRKMIKGVLPINEAKNMLTNECVQKVCTNCKDKTKCFRLKNNMQAVFYDLITVGFERGKVTLLDIPNNVTSFCCKTSQILVMVNQLITQYKQYANMITNLDSSRLLLAEQLNGVARIMKDLSTQIDKDIVFDNKKESQIIDELTFNDIVCNDAVVYQKDNYTTNVNLLVRNQDVDNPLIRAVVSKVCKVVLEIKEIIPSEISGWSMINLATMSTYDILFGYAGICKNGEEISGDNYSVLRLGDSKFMLAICDGMGSGKVADKTSGLAISLVENFYKAGFDNDIILNCVNRLLALNNDENFTALDLCVVDLKNCFADFIKLGAPAGYIKHRDTTTQLNGGALPIGILEQMKPIYYKTVLNDQDLIILCSDGVSDAFQSPENLKVFINNLQTLHPQKLADEILAKALSLYKGVANDDMSVVVGRIFKKFG